MQERRSHTLVDGAIAALRQGRELLEALGDEIYSSAMPPIFNHAVGSHFRHLLDFYTAFLDGLEARRIDYDARERDQGLEKNRRLAIAKIDSLIGRMSALAVTDEASPVLVRLEDDSDDQTSWSHSTLLREAQFLQSHTVHHYALMAMMLRLQGVDLNDKFGVAPSTLKQWRAA